MRFSVLVLTLLCLVLTAVPSFGGKAAVSFDAAVNYPSGAFGGNSVVATSVLQDGGPWPDLVVATNAGVSVFLNDQSGDGGYIYSNTYPTGGSFSSSVAVVDLNGDGFPDIVVTNECLSGPPSCYGISVLMNDQLGDGGFLPAVNYDSGGLESGQVVVGVLTSTGNQDLIVASNCQLYTCVDGTVTELLGNGDGTFQAYSTLSDAKAPIALGVMRTGSGLLDLVTSAGVMLGNGDGTFQAPSESIVPGALSITLAQTTGSGNLDLLAAVPKGVSVQLGNGDGTIGSSTVYKTGPETDMNPLAIAVADFNGDNNPDLAVLDQCLDYGHIGCLQGSQIYVLPGNGNGTFQPAVGPFYLHGFQGTSVAEANTTQRQTPPGKPDLIGTAACAVNVSSCATNGVVAVLLNNFTVSTTTTLVPSAMSWTLGTTPLVTFTATVSTLNGVSPVPDGSSVTFTDSVGPTTLCATTTVSQIATCTTGFTAPGTQAIVATYAGDIWHTSSHSNVVEEKVNKYVSATTVTATQTAPGAPVMLTATVTSGQPGGPQGSVYFNVNGKFDHSEPLVSGVATYTLTKPQQPTAGTLITVTAEYQGETPTAPSNGSTTYTVQ